MDEAAHPFSKLWDFIRKNTVPKTKLPETKSPRPLDRELIEDYFSILASEYRVMDEAGKMSNPVAAEEAREIIERCTDKPDEIRWRDVFKLELAILILEPLKDLRRHAYSLRAQFKQISTVEELDAYEASQPPDPDNAEEEKLRTDLIAIRKSLNWSYTARWTLEKFRDWLTNKIAHSAIFSMLLSIILFLAILVVPLAKGFGQTKWSSWAFYCLVAMMIGAAGYTGGCISTLRRIQEAKFNGSSVLSLIEYERHQGYLSSISLSPVYGALFALILSALFAGGFMNGSFFPDLTDFSKFGIVEEAKLYIWSFIAGFAETFVPDRLDELAKKTKTKD